LPEVSRTKKLIAPAAGLYSASVVSSTGCAPPPPVLPAALVAVDTPSALLTNSVVPAFTFVQSDQSVPRLA
jgi:hypothetical protein